MVCALSAGEVTKLTRIGQFDMSAPANAAMALLKKLRGPRDKNASSGANQMKMLRRLPKILRFIPGTAQDVRGFGLLKSDQVVKMPYSVDYFVDLSGLTARDLEWNAQTQTLIVNAPDVKPGKPNVDESRRTLVRTNGVFVTRQAGEELSRRASAHAQARAQASATSPERMAQAREYGRAAVAKIMAAPLGAMGYGDARVLVTFPPERRGDNRERWDVTTPINEVLEKHK